LFTGVQVSAEMSEVAMVTPAEGPSVGIPPDGTWMWMSASRESPGRPRAGRDQQGKCGICCSILDE